jgi:hypothetical protein
VANAEYVLLVFLFIQSLPQPMSLSLFLPYNSPLTPHTDTYQYNIPRCIPNGEYLLRIQQLAIHNPGSVPQFYISCAQITVTGGGSANPSPTVKIPGAFKASDPGYTANVSCSRRGRRRELVESGNVRWADKVVAIDLQQLQLVHCPGPVGVPVLGKGNG